MFTFRPQSIDFNIQQILNNDELKELINEYNELSNKYISEYNIYPEVYSRFLYYSEIYENTKEDFDLYDKRMYSIKDELAKNKKEIDTLISRLENIKVNNNKKNNDIFMKKYNLKSNDFEIKMKEYRYVNEIRCNMENLMRIKKEIYDNSLYHYYNLENELKIKMVNLKLLKNRINYLYDNYIKQKYEKELNEEINIMQNTIKNKSKRIKKNLNLDNILKLPDELKDIIKDYIPYSVKEDILCSKNPVLKIIKSIPIYFLNIFYKTYKPKEFKENQVLIDKYISKQIYLLYLNLKNTSEKNSYKLIRTLYICNTVINPTNE
jgi:hypothetical protein